MSIWGKIVGTGLGAAFGGPAGALAGFALGHRADRGRLFTPPGGDGTRWHSVPEKLIQAGADPQSAALFGAVKMAAMLGRRNEAIGLGALALSVKLAKIDRPILPSEVRKIRALIAFPADQADRVGRLFDIARRRTDDYLLYAEALQQASWDDPAPLEELMNLLIQVARADQPPHPPLNAAQQEARQLGLSAEELAFLQNVHQAFRLSPSSWARITGGETRARSGHLGQAYSVLGVHSGMQLEEIRLKWRALILRHHPDRMGSLSEKERRRLDELVKTINAAWDVVKMNHSPP